MKIRNMNRPISLDIISIKLIGNCELELQYGKGYYEWQNGSS
jgi:hypothetical protein